MRAKLIAILSAMALSVCAVAVAISFMFDIAVPFDRSDGRWRVAVSRGSLLLDNLPQRLAESMENRRALERANERLASMRQELPSLQRRVSDELSAAIASHRETGDADFSGYQAAQQALINHMQAMATPPPATQTPYSSHSIPLVIPMVALAAPCVLLWCARRRRQWRIRKGFCPVCGYNLTESPGGCPECGTGRAST